MQNVNWKYLDGKHVFGVSTLKLF